MKDLATTRYAQCGDLSIAYQIVGDGPFDLVVVPGLVSHVEFFHQLPGHSRFREAHWMFAEMGATGHAERLAKELGC